MERKSPSTGLGASAFARALPRHVSAEGCQFVVEPRMLAKGARLRFALKGHAPVIGTVRWVVQDRAGFAFDAPISQTLLRVMREQGLLASGLELYQA